MKILSSILILVSLIACWLYLWNNDNSFSDIQPSNLDTPALDQEAPTQNPIKHGNDLAVTPSTTTSNWLQLTRQQLQSALDNSDYELATNIFDQAYDRASSEELASFTAKILAHAATQAGNSKPEAVIQLIGPFAEAYDDLDAWRMLVSALTQSKQWPELLDALKRTNRLEVDSQRYADNLKAMVRVASNLGTEFERRNDRIAILNLYQQLYEEYPQHPRFQLELARAHIALNSTEDAIPLLQGLVYDPDYGSIASQHLELFEQESQANEQQAKTDAGHIIVPLIRAGTSLLVDARIDGVRSRLLLDTGASITALSIDLIEGLGLQATGRTIRINTANGTTSSRLFGTETLSIGPLVFQNLVVAEIDLSSGGQINGLLGTDVLRQMGDQYSYLIDDQNNALIFRPR